MQSASRHLAPCFAFLVQSSPRASAAAAQPSLQSKAADFVLGRASAAHRPEELQAAYRKACEEDTSTGGARALRMAELSTALRTALKLATPAPQSYTPRFGGARQKTSEGAASNMMRPPTPFGKAEDAKACPAAAAARRPYVDGRSVSGSLAAVDTGRRAHVSSQANAAVGALAAAMKYKQAQAQAKGDAKAAAAAATKAEAALQVRAAPQGLDPQFCRRDRLLTDNVPVRPETWVGSACQCRSRPG